MDKPLYAPLRQWPAQDITPAPKHGMDYQGRWPVPGALDQRPGLHLVDSSDNGAAHAHAGITSDSDSDDAPRNEGAGAVLVPVCFALFAVACFALYAFLSAVPQ